MHLAKLFRARYYILERRPSLTRLSCSRRSIAVVIAVLSLALQALPLPLPHWIQGRLQAGTRVAWLAWSAGLERGRATGSPSRDSSARPEGGQGKSREDGEQRAHFTRDATASRAIGREETGRKNGEFSIFILTNQDCAHFGLLLAGLLPLLEPLPGPAGPPAAR